MPCYDHRDHPSTEDARRNDAAQIEGLRQSARILELEERNNVLARIACEAMTEIEKHNDWFAKDGSHYELAVTLFSKELQTWWKKHKAFDATRKAKEDLLALARKAEKAEEERVAEIRRQAMERLTEEEIEALGLDD